MTHTLAPAFEIAAETSAQTSGPNIRRPQDHGPLSAAELSIAKEQRAITAAHAGAYDALCQRYGEGSGATLRIR